jgi:hypothetical protein
MDEPPANRILLEFLRVTEYYLIVDGNAHESINRTCCRKTIAYGQKNVGSGEKIPNG